MLKGSLDDFTLPDIFRLMSFAKKTGRLDVVRSAGEGKVFFREGEVYFAESSISKEPLGQKLIRARALSEGQLMKALDEHKATGRRIGEVLVESGAVTVEQLENAVRQQVEDAIFDLLRWELGEFSWEPGAELGVEIAIAVSVENLIMEASRRLDEFEVIKRKIPSEETILGMAPTPPEGAVEINITPDEWRILVLVDGNRSVAQIGESVGLDAFGAMRVLYGLVSAGLIEVVDGSVPVDEAPAPQAEAEEAPVAVAEPEPTPEPEVAEVQEPAAEEVVAEAPPEQSPVDEPVVEEPVVEEVLEPEVAAQVEVEEVTPEPEPAAPDEDLMDVIKASIEPETISEDVLSDPLGDLEAGGEMTAEDMEAFGIAPPVAAASDDADAAWTEAPEVTAFDAPGPDDLVTETPAAPDPFVADLFSDVGPSNNDNGGSDGAMSPMPEAPPVPEAPQEDIPASSTPGGEAPVVDRAAVVRELAGLFSDDIERPRARPAVTRPAGSKPTDPADAEGDDERKRVEDDDQVTKGIITRLIDGVKGL